MLTFLNSGIYCFSNLETESRKVRFEQDGHNFKVKRGFPEGIEIQIHLTPQNNKLSGTYKITETGLLDTIEGDILNNGQCLEIHPQGFNQRKTWIFKCKTLTKNPTKFIDFCKIS